MYAFDASKLSGDTRSRLSVCDPRYLSNDNDNSEVGLESALRARNTMHNRVVADAFIPGSKLAQACEVLGEASWATQIWEGGSGAFLAEQGDAVSVASLLEWWVAEERQASLEGFLNGTFGSELHI